MVVVVRAPDGCGVNEGASKDGLAAG